VYAPLVVPSVFEFFASVSMQGVQLDCVMGLFRVVPQFFESVQVLVVVLFTHPIQLEQVHEGVQVTGHAWEVIGLFASVPPLLMSVQFLVCVVLPGMHALHSSQTHCGLQEEIHAPLEQASFGSQIS
jgi:hypothetical protein